MVNANMDVRKCERKTLKFQAENVQKRTKEDKNRILGKSNLSNNVSAAERTDISRLIL